MSLSPAKRGKQKTPEYQQTSVNTSIQLVELKLAHIFEKASILEAGDPIAEKRMYIPRVNSYLILSQTVIPFSHLLPQREHNLSEIG